MNDHYFISYSSVDGSDFAVHLADELASGPPSIPVWLDKRNLQPGYDWDTQVELALHDCRGMLFLMTEDSLAPNSPCKAEWVRALKYKKRVIPIRTAPGLALPLRLDPRNYVDFADGFESGLARLRKHLIWCETPAGELQELRDRLADAKRDLMRVEPQQHARVQEDIDELGRLIAERQSILDDPVTAQARVQQRIANGLYRERRPEGEPAARRAKFINPPPVTPPSWFQGRTHETRQIAEFLRDDGLRMMIVAGRGGVGKSALVCRVLKTLQGGRLPDDLGDLQTDGIIYLSPVGTHLASLPNLYEDLTRLLPDELAERLMGHYREQRSVETLMLSLLEVLPPGPVVVLLDNFEDLVEPHSYAVADPDLGAALRTVLTGPEHGLKIIMTTRTIPVDLMYVQPARHRRLDLEDGLASPFAENMLRAMDPDGRLGLKTAPPEDLACAREYTRGFPRALEALAAILNADRDTTLQELLGRAAQALPDQIVEVLVGQAFSRLERIDQQILQALSVYGSPVPAVAVDYILEPFIPTIDSGPALSRLVNMHFAFSDARRYYLHPIDRAYVRGLIPPGESAEDDSYPSTSRAGPTLHDIAARVADYYERTRILPRNSWKRLEDVEPQLREFEFRCEVEDFEQAAYVLDDFFWEAVTWGHYELLAQKAERIRTWVEDDDTQILVLRHLVWCRAAQGRYDEAVQLTEQALTIARDTGNRPEECIALGRLGWCRAAQGRYDEAVQLTEQALTIARNAGNRPEEGIGLERLGYYRAAQGRYDEAVQLTEQALTIARDTGNRREEGIGLRQLGKYRAAHGRRHEATQLTEQALTIARDIGNRREEGRCLRQLGYCRAAERRHDEAVQLTEQALTIARDTGNRREEGRCLQQLGYYRTVQGRYDEAARLNEQGLTIVPAIGDWREEGRCLGQLGY